MISVTRLNKKEFYLNPHQIEFMEATPDNVITMLSGKKLVVLESPDEVIVKIVNYRRDLSVPIVRDGEEIASTANDL